jgi:hypothetical protein
VKSRFSKASDFKYEIDRLKEIELKEWWVRFPERYNPRGKAPSNLWDLPIPVQGSWSSNGLRHACPFPFPLVERILRLTTDPNSANLVFDPFAGSGIVLAVAEQMGQCFLGFELNPRYVAMYRTTVRSWVRREWNMRRQHLNNLGQRRRALKSQILKLRVTKYPRTLMTQLRRALGPSPPAFLGALCVASSQLPVKPHHLLTVKVVLITKDARKAATLKTAIPHVIAVPPLSKFGLNAQVSAIPLSAAAAHFRRLDIANNTHLAIYRNGRTYRYDDATTLGRWLDSLPSLPDADRSRFPPIAASIRVAQKIQRTWFPQGALNGSP